MKPGTLVEVEMDDMEHVSHGWKSFDDITSQGRTAYKAAGYLIASDKHFTVIGSVTNDEAHAFCAFRIPTGAIRSIKEAAGMNGREGWQYMPRVKALAPMGFVYVSDESDDRPPPPPPPLGELHNYCSSCWGMRDCDEALHQAIVAAEIG